MNTPRACVARNFLVALLALPLASACDDAAGGPAGGAGASGSHTSTAGSTAGASGAPGELECPVDLPAMGEPCQTRPNLLCVWKGKGGPCPPDEDQLRACNATTGTWSVARPAIACRGKPMLVDAGEDAGL